MESNSAADSLGRIPADARAKGAPGGGGGGGGGGRFEIGANNLFFNPNPATGQVSLSGYVVVTFGAISSGSFIPPDDTIVTANGVALLRDPMLNGAYWRVDPAGAQPQVGTDGQLTLSATSVSSKLARTLTLACAPDEVITATPAEGSSLTGVDSLSLSWAASLTSHVTSLPVPENASALLWGYDSATNSLGNAVTFVPVVGTLGTTIAVGPADSPGYAVEVSWPGQYLLDGQSGGQCGRVKRMAFAQ
jgi:hypothetical protein